MFPRLRLVAAGFVLSGMLALSLLGVVSSSASTKAGGKVSASLSKTSFTAAQATTVKLVCKFSPASKRFDYLLSLKKGAKWVTLRSVNKTGSFKGSCTMTVKKLFGSKPVKVGQYRVKVSADVNSVTRSFKVVKAAPTPAPGAFNKTSPANGATGQPVTTSLRWGASSNAASYEYCIDTTNNNACDGSWVSMSAWVSTSAATSASLSGLTLGATYYWQVRAINAKGTTDAGGGSWFSFTVSGPTAGSWVSTGLSGPIGNGLGAVTVTSIFFNVQADQATVSSFGFVYSYHYLYYPYCSGDDGRTWLNQPLSPIVGGQFSDPTGVTQVWGEQTGSLAYGTGHFSGTFDSPTTAHGTAELIATIRCGSSQNQIADMGPFSWTAAWQSAS
jgi:hypothetical protein